MRLRPEQRLRKQADFKKLVERGAFARGVFFFVWTEVRSGKTQKTRPPRPSVGIVVSREKDARATRRNILKRRIREIFRKHQSELHPGSVCLIKARAAKTEPSFAEMEQELMALFKRTGAWK